MSFLLKKLILKLGQKSAKVDPHDIFTQTTADDLVHIIKELIL